MMKIKEMELASYLARDEIEDVYDRLVWMKDVERLTPRPQKGDNVEESIIRCVEETLANSCYAKYIKRRKYGINYEFPLTHGIYLQSRKIIPNGFKVMLSAGSLMALLSELAAHETREAIESVVNNMGLVFYSDIVKMLSSNQFKDIPLDAIEILIKKMTTRNNKDNIRECVTPDNRRILKWSINTELTHESLRPNDKFLSKAAKAIGIKPL